MASEQERLSFCKTAAELGYTPSELVSACRQKQANPLGWLAASIGSGIAEALPAAAEFVVEAPFKVLGLATALGALGGAGVAGTKDLVRNEYPHMFKHEATPASSELDEERIRQLIARYRSAVQKINEAKHYEDDVQNPTQSSMMRYEFGGFGD